MAKRKFTVDILVYLSNRPDSVKSCLQALLKYHSPSSNIILIGDKLSNTLHSFILGLCSKCRNEVSIGLLNNTAHLGYVNSINKHLSRGSSEYVVVIDDNVIVTKGWIEKLQSCIENDPTTGIVCPVTSIGFRQSVCKDLPNNFTIDSFADYISKTTLKKYPETTSADFCLFFRRELIQKVGNFSPVTFTEVDYCHRARQQGYKIVVADDTFIFTRNSCVSGVVADDALFFATKPLRYIQYDRARQIHNLAIIIPVYNQLECIQKCLLSIKKKSVLSNKIVIVNDASEKTTTLWLEKYCKDNKFVYLHNSQNEGFSYSCNRGIEAVRADYYCLLNSDTIIGTVAWDEKILQCGDRFENTMVLGALSNDATMQSIPSAGPIIQGYNADTFANYIDLISEKRYPIVPLVNGFCYVMKKRCIKEVGLLDEKDFPHYGSEDDLSLRVKEREYDLRIVDDVFIYHENNRSYGKKREKDIKKVSIKNFFSKWKKYNINALIHESNDSLDYLRNKITQKE